MGPKWGGTNLVEEKLQTKYTRNAKIMGEELYKKKKRPVMKITEYRQLLKTVWKEGRSGWGRRPRCQKTKEEGGVIV